jgi:hypothetical protein
MQTQCVDAGKVGGVKIVLGLLGAVLLAVGLAGLFPESAARIAASLTTNMFIEFSADSKGWHVMGVVGGAASVAGIWMLYSAFRRS